MFNVQQGSQPVVVLLDIVLSAWYKPLRYLSATDATVTRFSWLFLITSVDIRMTEQQYRL